VNQQNACTFAIARATPTNCFAWDKKSEHISSYELAATAWQAVATIADEMGEARVRGVQI
jgi:hypothetical protein